MGIVLNLRALPIRKGSTETPCRLRRLPVSDADEEHKTKPPKLERRTARGSPLFEGDLRSLDCVVPIELLAGLWYVTQT